MGVAAGDSKSAAEIIATKSAGWFGFFRRSRYLGGN
jgi:hypothetical protein